jgi:hypothetical protein
MIWGGFPKFGSLKSAAIPVTVRGASQDKDFLLKILGRLTVAGEKESLDSESLDSDGVSVFTFYSPKFFVV